jgi:hypothetical protein
MIAAARGVSCKNKRMAEVARSLCLSCPIRKFKGTRFEGIGPTYRIALLSKRRTDVLLVSLKRWPPGVFADSTTVEGRAALYSFAFLVASGCLHLFGCRS